MDFLKKYNLAPVKVLKAAGLAIAVVIVLSFVIRLISSSFFGSLSVGSGGIVRTMMDKISTPNAADMAIGEMRPKASYGGQDSGVGLSVRNVIGSVGYGSEIMPPEGPSPVSGDEAEEYEVTEYYVNVETRHLDDDCRAVAGLKGKDYVVFENANEYDRGCSYTFKVRKDNVPEILAAIEALDPKDLNENTRTIKRLVEDYASELEILQKRLDSTNATLEGAIRAYDEITDVAAKTRNAEALAKIIDSKITIIERLTNERISVSSQMERLARSKAEQLDRLEYTYFYLNMVEDKLIDGEQLADSWKAAVRDFVTDVNRIAQDISVNLVVVLLMIVQWAIYLLMLILVAKYGRAGAEWIWRR